ncbi:putative disease resistance protein rga3 [Phtheirospermum japonicum]|uniref:Putative disease resistance protein rga3 n=1 Tax=Phtheirospermum japonicum TaxID=374723 RepID=A0A830CP00_9LAMI|nr:putative disease resistance protein rga3 [Phtheirospermum japonicum]
MAEAAVGATIQVLLEHLLTLSKEQIGLVRNFKKDLEKLQKTISMVNDLLHDAEKRQVTDSAVKRWLRELEALAFEADNVFDDISYQLLSKKVGPTENKTVMKKVQSFFSCSCSSNDHTISHRLQLGRRIKDINEMLKSINQQANEFGLQTRIASAQAPVSEIPETDSFSADPVYGREYDVSMIVKKLTTATPSPAEQVLSVLPIVGMGGLGKTTLARKVFGDEQIISHFGDNRVWVHVPRNFDIRNILKNILTSLKNEKVELETRQALLQKLQEHLKTKRYLLVLDDVWDEERDKWDSFVNSLSGISSATGNCMIVTTRSQAVASIAKTGRTHELGCLSGDECWSIIKAKAFINSGDIPMEFETVGRNIAKRCQGLPLAAKVVGGLLRDKSVLHIVSIFHKGYRIEKERLIELWMAEGFLQSETTGSKFFNLLLQNSLLQVVERDDYGNVTHCNMHDLVHDLAFSVLCENDNVTDGVCQRRYIGYESSGDGLLSVPKGQERYVRTLFFSGKVSDISLRHLHIPDSTALPPEMGKLTSLQTLPYFHVGREKGCGISELGSLKDLKGKIEIRNLEKVRDKNEARMADLLQKPGIYELKLVWHISREGDGVNDESVLEGLQPHPNIKGLEIFGFNGKRLPLWEGLNNLMKIKLTYCSGCEELPMLGHLPRLKSLCLDGLTNVKYIRSSFYGDIDSSVIVFPALERLELLDMPNLKEWDEVNEVVVFPRLEYLKVKDCRQLMRAPSHFPCLQELEIYGMESSLALENICGMKLTTLTHLDIRETGVECLPDGLFSNNHNLSMLRISNCPKMTRLVPCLGGGGAPSLLRELIIWYCSSLRELPDDLHSLNSLEVLEIMDCPDLKSIPYPISSGGGGQQQGFTSLRELRIEKCEGLTNLPIEMVESLEELTLRELSSIRNMGMVIGCLHRMTRLRQLIIGEVSKFSSKDIIGTNNSLQELYMDRFSDSSSWNNVSFNEAVDAMLLQSISLRKLELFGMEHWDSLPDQLQHLTSLEGLRLDDFGIEAMPEWFGNLSSLKELTLWGCKKLRHLPSKQAMQRLSKLTYLRIDRCPLLLLNNNNNNNTNYELLQIDDSEWPKISHIPNIKVDWQRISSDRH